MPGLFPTPLDYTDRDYASAVVRLRDLARTVFPEWTDFSRVNFGNFLLNAFAWVLDNLSYYLDASAREAFLPTLTRRISLIRHGRLFAFTLPGATAATGTARVTIPVDANNRTIALGSRFRAAGGDADPVQFRSTAAGTILIGGTFVDVPVEQSVAVTETFASNGSPNQEFVLSGTPYLDNSAVITTVIEGAFTQVETLLDSGSNDRHYVVLVDDQDRATVRMGSGVNGRIPTGTVTIAYRRGGGLRGNIDAHQLRIVEEIPPDGFGTINGSVDNAVAFAGGAERMTAVRGRRLAAAQLRSITRSVTKGDFEANAQLVAGVARALMATSNEDAAVAENTGRLSIVGLGAQTVSGRTRPATPSATTLAAVTTMVTVTRPQTVTFAVTVEAATFTTVDVTARVALEPGASAATTGTNALEALRDLFAVLDADGNLNPDIDFGANLAESDGTITGELPWSHVFNALRDAAGIRKVDEGPQGLLLNGLRRSIFLDPRAFPRLRNVTITDLDTDAVIASAAEPAP